MKILIIGKNSYIGNHIDDWLTSYDHQVTQLDVLTEEWKTYDYRSFDAIIHVAGIVHRPDCKDWVLYKRVNTDMPLAIATMAKQQGVKQYVYFSTMGVYQAAKSLSGCIIDEHTPIKSESFYGRSKLMAEEELVKLQDETYDISFVRPPSVYGKGCRGGYIKGFASIARLLPVIPRAYCKARQSFIYIDNLCECVRIIIENHYRGVFCPQDDEIPNANELLRTISEGLEKKYYDSRLLGVCLRFISFIPIVKKAYGGISYSRQLSEIKGHNYIVVPFKDGMKRTVAEL